jgi:hypothetical protein
MATLEQLVDKARTSLLFTAPVLGPDMERFLRVQGPQIKALAKQAIDEKVEHIYWVGSGNSWVNLYSGKYLLDKFTNLPVICTFLMILLSVIRRILAQKVGFSLLPSPAAQKIP